MEYASRAVGNAGLATGIIGTALGALNGAGGLYDTETIFKVLNDLVKEYGGIPVTIPPIKFITSTETILTFRSGDIEKLEDYVNKAKENGENA